MAIASHFLWNTFGQPFQQCISGPKVFQYDRPWLAIDSAGFYDAPVIMSSGGSFLKSCHVSVYVCISPPLLSSIIFTPCLIFRVLFQQAQEISCSWDLPYMVPFQISYFSVYVIHIHSKPITSWFYWPIWYACICKGRILNKLTLANDNIRRLADPFLFKKLLQGQILYRT